MNYEFISQYMGISTSTAKNSSRETTTTTHVLKVHPNIN